MRSIRSGVILLALFWTISLPCFASLTQEDMRQIREIIREEIAPMKKEIESVKLEVATIKGDIRAIEGKMATKEDLLSFKMTTKDDLLSLWKDMMSKIETLYGLIIGVLIAIIVSVVLPSVVLPPIFQKWLERRKTLNNEDRFHKIEAELEELKATMGSTEGKRGL